MSEDLLILGGSGFVGSRLCDLAQELQGGCVGTITVATRHMLRAQHLLVLPGVDVAEVDLFDDAALARLLAGRATVVNLVGLRDGSDAEFDAVHAQLPWRLARLGAQLGVQRIVHLSVVDARLHTASAYLRSKALGEAALLDGPVPADVLRPTLVFGVHDRFLGVLARLARRRARLALACPELPVQPVWVDDLVRAILACLRRPELPKRVCECAGPEVLTLREIAQQVAAWVGGELHIAHEPALLRRAEAWWQRQRHPDEAEAYRLASMQQPCVASGRVPGLNELGIRPTPMAHVAPQFLAPGPGRQWELDAWRSATPPSRTAYRV